MPSLSYLTSYRGLPLAIECDSRAEALTYLQDDERVVVVCLGYLGDVLPKQIVQVESEMVFDADVPWDEKGLVWEVTAIDGTFISNAGTAEEALAEADRQAMERG